MSWEEGGEEEKGLPESNGTNEVLGRQTVSRHVARLVLVHGKKNMWHRIGTPAGNAKISALMRLAAAAMEVSLVLWSKQGLDLVPARACHHCPHGAPPHRGGANPKTTAHPRSTKPRHWLPGFSGLHPRHHGLQRSAFCPPPPPGQSSSHPCSPPGLLRARLDTRTRVPSNNGQLHPSTTFPPPMTGRDCNSLLQPIAFLDTSAPTTSSPISALETAFPLP